MATITGRITDYTGAEPTNRLIPGDENFEYPEWSETAKLDGNPIRIYYRTTPEDAARIAETNDGGSIDWKSRITKIVEVLEDGCDGAAVWSAK